MKEIQRYQLEISTVKSEMSQLQNRFQNDLQRKKLKHKSKIENLSLDVQHIKTQFEQTKSEKDKLNSKIKDLERQIDIGLSDKRYERQGSEGLNKQIQDLNSYNTELKTVNEELQSQVGCL